MIKAKIYNKSNPLTSKEKEDTINFLHTYLEKYRDTKEDITKALHFALKEADKRLNSMPLGGFILNAMKGDQIVGSVVINRTGMNGYIPDNILVYIATHTDMRGQGIGKLLMKKTLEIAEGDVALHVEPDNPARHLYEKLGFEKKYVEMRYSSQ